MCVCVCVCVCVIVPQTPAVGSVFVFLTSRSVPAPDDVSVHSVALRHWSVRAAAVARLFAAQCQPKAGVEWRRVGGGGGAGGEPTSASFFFGRVRCMLFTGEVRRLSPFQTHVTNSRAVEKRDGRPWC